MNNLQFVHRYLPGKTPDARLLLLLHGTGGDESDLLPLGRELASEAAFLSPRGKASENGAARFFRRDAEGVFDEGDVIRRAHELADFVVAAAAQYHFDLTRVIAVGYSNGANIAAALLLLRPEVLSGAVLFRAMVPLSQPPLASDLKHKPVFISAGAADPIIPASNAEQLAALLKDRGAAVTLRVIQASHRLVREDVTSAKAWLDLL
ncbi:MAG TPA: alpha/beta hydrolase [Chthoniobacterales bacterium]|nr:alpha/beta hydrolase [Chthoniobacterales bacterium]